MKTARIVPHERTQNEDNTIPNWSIVYNTQTSNYYVIIYVYFMNLLPFHIVKYYIVHKPLKFYGNNWNICHTIIVYSVELTCIFNIFINNSKTPFIFFSNNITIFFYTAPKETEHNAIFILNPYHFMKVYNINILP